MKEWICKQCQHFEEEEEELRWLRNIYGNFYPQPAHYTYYCNKLLSAVITAKKECPHFLSIHQTKFKVGENNMVKIGDLEQSSKRGNLSDLKPGEYKAIKEYIKDSASGQTGGLCIVYEDRKGITWTQKYTSTMQSILAEHLTKLKLTDTEELQSAWYEYALKQAGRGIFKRLFPTKKVK